MRPGSGDCNPAFDLVLWKLICPLLFSGGVFLFTDTGMKSTWHPPDNHCTTISRRPQETMLSRQQSWPLKFLKAFRTKSGSEEFTITVRSDMEPVIRLRYFCLCTCMYTQTCIQLLACSVCFVICRRLYQQIITSSPQQHKHTTWNRHSNISWNKQVIIIQSGQSNAHIQQWQTTTQLFDMPAKSVIVTISSNRNVNSSGLSRGRSATISMRCWLRNMTFLSLSLSIHTSSIHST